MNNKSLQVSLSDLYASMGTFSRLLSAPIQSFVCFLFPL